MNFLLHPWTAMAFLLVVALVLAFVLFPQGTAQFFRGIVDAIVGKPRVIAYTGHRYGVKNGAVSTQGTKIEISTDAGTTWVVIGGTTDVIDPSGEAADLDATNLASTRKEYIAGLVDAAAVTLNGQRLATDPGQTKLLGAVGTVVQFRQTLSNGEIEVFNGLVKKFGVTGAHDAVLMFAASIRPTGSLTYSGTGHTT